MISETNVKRHRVFTQQQIKLPILRKAVKENENIPLATVTVVENKLAILDVHISKLDLDENQACLLAFDDFVNGLVEIRDKYKEEIEAAKVDLEPKKSEEETEDEEIEEDEDVDDDKKEHYVEDEDDDEEED